MDTRTLTQRGRAMGRWASVLAVSAMAAAAAAQEDLRPPSVSPDQIKGKPMLTTIVLLAVLAAVLAAALMPAKRGHQD